MRQVIRDARELLQDRLALDRTRAHRFTRRKLEIERGFLLERPELQPR